MAEKFSHKHPSVTEEQQIPFVDIAIPLVGDSSSAKVCLFMLCIVVIVIHPFLYLIRLSVCQIDSQSRFSPDTSVNYSLPTNRCCNKHSDHHCQDAVPLGLCDEKSGCPSC